jgi:hypothetical protein
MKEQYPLDGFVDTDFKKGTVQYKIANKDTLTKRVENLSLVRIHDFTFSLRFHLF